MAMLARDIDGEIESRISDVTIIESYLRPKIEGKAVEDAGLVVDLGDELYSQEPWLLPQTAHPILNPREWFYFGKKRSKYRIVQGVDHEGFWGILDARSPIQSEETGEIIGATNRFRYHIKNKGNWTGLEDTNWFMREYRLFYPVNGTISKRVFCKIYEIIP